MAWTAPKTWTVGEVLTASDMNTHLRDNLTALRMGQRVLYLNYTTTQAYGTAGVWTLASLNNVVHADWLGAGTADRITVLDAGWYAFYWEITPSGQTGTGSNLGRVAHKDSGDVLLSNAGSSPGVLTNSAYSGSWIGLAGVGDYFELEALQSMSGTGGSFTSEFAAVHFKAD